MAAMATMTLAMWLQEQDLAHTNHLIMIFIGLVAVAMTVMAIALIVVAVVASKAAKSATAVMDEFKVKLLPLIDAGTEISKSTRVILNDATPKVKIITENLVKTSETLVQTSRVAKSAVEKIDVTIGDANMRAQRQVARVDGMVSTALDTTSEIVESINHGIRVPAHKIATMATQAKFVVEGLLDKFKAMTAGMPFVGRKDPSRP